MVRRFIVSGKVQGVFFRASTQAQAKQLGLTGYAMNRADSCVDVVACGDSAKLQQLYEWLQQGPPQARVDRVEEQPCSDQSSEQTYADFTIF